MIEPDDFEDILDGILDGLIVDGEGEFSWAGFIVLAIIVGLICLFLFLHGC